MTRALLAEWTKLRTVPSTVAVAAGLAAAMVAGTAVVISGTDLPMCAGRSVDCPAVDTTALTLAGVHFAQLAAIWLAAVVVGAEFQPRTIRMTLAMDPRRVEVFTAKMAVIAVTVLGGAALGVAGALGAGAVLFSGTDVIAAHPADLPRAAGGTVLYLVLVALLSAGVATVLRHAGGTIGAVVALLYGPYLLTTVVPLPIRTLHLVQDLAPMTAGLGTAPLGRWAGLGVLAAYAFVALVWGGSRFVVRDA